MYLLFFIILFSFLGFALVTADPLFAASVGFAIIAGCLFKIIHMLNDLHKHFSIEKPKKESVQEVFDRYLKERDDGKKE